MHGMEDLALGKAGALARGKKGKRALPCAEPANKGTSVLDEEAAEEIGKELLPHQEAWKAELMNKGYAHSESKVNPLPEVSEFWFSAESADWELNRGSGKYAQGGPKQAQGGLNFVLLADGSVAPYTLCGKLGKASSYVPKDGYHLGQGMYLGRFASLEDAQSRAGLVKESMSWEICRRVCEKHGLRFGGPVAPAAKRSPAI